MTSHPTGSPSTSTVRPLLVRGMLAGLVGGVLAFGVASLVGEGPLGAAVALEPTGEHTHGAATGAAPAGEPELVSRAVQSTLGLGTVAVLVGVALGGLFGLVAAVAQGRLGRLGPRGSAAFLAAAAFAAVSFLPQLMYPPDPPGAAPEDTVDLRTGAYLAALTVTVAVVAGVVVAARAFADRLGTWNGALLAGAAGLAVLVLAAALLPAVGPTPDGIPADLLWRFRLASFAVSATMWTGIGLVFGAATEHALRREQQRRELAAAL